VFVSGGQGDQARLWVDGRMVIDAWGPESAAEGALRGQGLWEGMQVDRRLGMGVGVTVPMLGAVAAARKAYPGEPETVERYGGEEERALDARAAGVPGQVLGEHKVPVRAWSHSFLRHGARRPLADAGALVRLRPGHLHDIRLEWRGVGHAHAACRLEWAVPSRFLPVIAARDAAGAGRRYGDLLQARDAPLVGARAAPFNESLSPVGEEETEGGGQYHGMQSAMGLSLAAWREAPGGEAAVRAALAGTGTDTAGALVAGAYARMAVPADSLWALWPLPGSPAPMEVAAGPAAAAGEAVRGLTDGTTYASGTAGSVGRLAGLEG